jgi:hypothetical protein
MAARTHKKAIKSIPGRRNKGEAIPLLQLNLHREFFAAIAEGRKHIEYRAYTAYWRQRLEGRRYRAICFRNGYGKSVPEMVVEFLGVRRIPDKRVYAIRLGRVLEIRRWPP